MSSAQRSLCSFAATITLSAQQEFVSKRKRTIDEAKTICIINCSDVKASLIKSPRLMSLWTVRRRQRLDSDMQIFIGAPERTVAAPSPPIDKQPLYFLWAAKAIASYTNYNYIFIYALRSVLRSIAQCRRALCETTFARRL